MFSKIVPNVPNAKLLSHAVALTKQKSQKLSAIIKLHLKVKSPFRFCNYTFFSVLYIPPEKDQQKHTKSMYEWQTGLI